MCNACIQFSMFWFITRILQYDVCITNKSYVYVAIRTIVITFYHIERMFLENSSGWVGERVTIHN